MKISTYWQCRPRLGVTRSATLLTVADVPCGYLEPENVTTPE